MVTAELAWDRIAEGDPIPALVKIPSTMQLFMFSAATWNRHRVHYDSAFARSEGLPDVAIHRALIGSFLAQMLKQWVREAGTVRQVEWSVRGSAQVGKPMRLAGTVRAKRREGDAALVECDIWAEDHEGATVAPGSAVVELHR